MKVERLVNKAFQTGAEKVRINPVLWEEKGGVTSLPGAGSYEFSLKGCVRMSHLDFPLSVFYLLKFYIINKAQLKNPSLITLTQTRPNLPLVFSIASKHILLLLWELSKWCFQGPCLWPHWLCITLVRAAIPRRVGEHNPSWSSAVRNLNNSTWEPWGHEWFFFSQRQLCQNSYTEYQISPHFFRHSDAHWPSVHPTLPKRPSFYFLPFYLTMAANGLYWYS